MSNIHFVKALIINRVHTELCDTTVMSNNQMLDLLMTVSVLSSH
jgi:hypothetical protein